MKPLNIVCLVLGIVSARPAIAQGSSDDALANTARKVAIEKLSPVLLQSVPADGSYRAAVFPFANRDGAIKTDELSKIGALLQEEISRSLRELTSQKATGKFRFLSPFPGLTTALETAGLEASPLYTSGAKGARLGLEKLNIQVAVFGRIAVRSHEELVGLAADGSMVSLAMTVVVPEKAQNVVVQVPAADLLKNPPKVVAKNPEPKEQPKQPNAIPAKSPFTQKLARCGVVNLSRYPAKVYWIDFQGQEKLVGTYAPSQATSANLYLGSVWKYEYVFPGKGIGRFQVSGNPEQTVYLKADNEVAESDLKSQGTGKRVDVIIDNKSNLTATIFMLDGQGNAKRVGTHPPGQEFKSKLEVGTVWRYTFERPGQPPVTGHFVIADLPQQNFSLFSR